ncbi:MAG: nucleotide exchange factor GrpE [Dysgonamonadaceae bacterium]|nr:nucleotide exchange factor GrpE [Dysgonamonadaceae bacterium]
MIRNNLQSISRLKNQLEQKEWENNDLLKGMALGIIDAIDSLERAEEVLKESEQDKNSEVAKITKRYQSVQTKLLNLLQKYGITKVEFPDNNLITGLCEVVKTEIDASKKNDEIVSIIRNGYKRGNELIRSAQIIVVKNE